MKAAYRISGLVAMALIGSVLLIASASAHEYWIEPSKTRAAAGETVSLTMAVGQDFVGDTQIYIPDRTVRFDVIGPVGTVSADAGFASDPAGKVAVSAPGLYTIVYQNKGNRITLDPETFETYARRDGLEHALAARAKAGTSDQPAREHYTRFPKTWVLSGDPSAGQAATEAVGMRFELVPASNPFTLSPGTTLPVSVLYEGKPLSGILVQAFHKQTETLVGGDRSDAAGLTGIELPFAGRWMISAVHLIPMPEDTALDWQSFWASFVIDIE
ncbi:MAG: DUF4198 domain-containing protein [Minwuia sp.]|nr:DUF4198 domain-containing protein [Minwuia sp.]